MPVGVLYRVLLCGFVMLVLTQPVVSQPAGWNASIASAASEEPQYISGDQWPGRPDGHRWVKLVVQFTSPGKQAKLPFDQIRLSNNDGNYPVTAVGYQVKPTDSIVYLPVLVVNPPHADKGMKDSSSKDKMKVGGGWSTLRDIKDGRFEPVSIGFFEKMDINKMLFDVELQGASGGKELRLIKSPLNVVLLFAVPEGAADLQLRVGDGVQVALPAVQ